MPELVNYLTERDFRKSVYRNVVQIIVKVVWVFCRTMNTDPQARSAAAHSSHYDGTAGIGGSLLLALFLAGLLVAVSYPVVVLAVALGAIGPTVVKKGTAAFAASRAPSQTPHVGHDRPKRRDLSD